jgi:hypothetical protein
MLSEERGILSPILGRHQATQDGKSVAFTGSVVPSNCPGVPAAGHTLGHTTWQEDRGYPPACDFVIICTTGKGRSAFPVDHRQRR